jgi:DnaA family protein
MALLDALDRFSLEQKRAVTLPLLRAMLASPDPDAPFQPSAPQPPAPQPSAPQPSALQPSDQAASSKIGPHG